MNNFKLGSLFDGSGGFPPSGALCGITPMWAAEVEPYPIAVTRSRFPNMKHLGDISKVNGIALPTALYCIQGMAEMLAMASTRKAVEDDDDWMN